MSKTKKNIFFILFYEVILTWQDIGGLVDRSYFFSNQEGSVFPVDSKSFCKSLLKLCTTARDPQTNPGRLTAQDQDNGGRRDFRG